MVCLLILLFSKYIMQSSILNTGKLVHLKSQLQKLCHNKGQNLSHIIYKRNNARGINAAHYKA